MAVKMEREKEGEYVLPSVFYLQDKKKLWTNFDEIFGWVECVTRRAD